MGGVYRIQTFFWIVYIFFIFTRPLSLEATSYKQIEVHRSMSLTGTPWTYIDHASSYSKKKKKTNT